MLKRFMYFAVSCLFLAVAFQMGSRTAGADRATNAPSEVAVISGNVRGGDVVPLPVYGDGTTALPEETHTIISLRNHTLRWPNGFREYNLFCYMDDNRTTRLYGKTPPGNAASSHDGWSVNYMAIATRDVTVAVREGTWGQIKGEFR